MKALLINGSPHPKGCTYTALEELARTLEAEGIETEIVQAGGRVVCGCTGCGACAQICPQGIDVPDVMRRFSEEIAKLPKWADICRERAQAQARLEKG